MSIIFPRYADHAANLEALVSDLQTLLIDLSEFEAVIPSSEDVLERTLEAFTKAKEIEDLLFAVAETLTNEGF